MSSDSSTLWKRRFLFASLFAFIGHLLSTYNEEGILHHSIWNADDKSNHSIHNHLTRRTYMSPREARHFQSQAYDMFNFSFTGYMQHAFPKDDLRPISCRGRNTQGGMALTLLDSLDTLLMLGDAPSLQKAASFLENNPNLFEKDVRIHVFEVTIRAIGGLLSAHTLLDRDSSLVPGYNGIFLRSAIRLADKLLPAFDTPTGLPTSWINLQTGHMRGDTRVTCTACAGTLLLEMGVLSRLTSNTTYEKKAKRAVQYLWNKRSVRNLLGNTINVDTGEWVRRDSGIGAGIDSFYEYLLKSYLSFGDRAYLDIFSEAYAAAQAHMALSGSVTGVNWLLDVHMTSGRVLHTYISSLSAFWPGLQVLTGQIEDAKRLHTDWTTAWDVFRMTPEMFHFQLDHHHPSMIGYPLRPELIESTFLLYSATNDHVYPHIGAAIAKKIASGSKEKCGHASVADVMNEKTEDTMESFFLSETAKYLYMLFANATGVLDHFVLSTEGHFFPVFEDAPSSSSTTSKSSSVSGSSHANADVDDKNKDSDDGDTSNIFTMNIEASIQKQCAFLCDTPAALASARIRTKNLLKSLPHLPLDHGAPSLLLRRRCTACKAVTRAVARAKHRADLMWRVSGDVTSKAGKITTVPLPWTSSRKKMAPDMRQFLCHLEEYAPKKLQCTTESIKEVDAEDLNSQGLQVLPHNAVFIGAVDARTVKTRLTAEMFAPEVLEVVVIGNDTGGVANNSRSNSNDHNNSSSNSSSTNNNTGVALSGMNVIKLPAVSAEFGPKFLPGCNASDPSSRIISCKAWEKKERKRLEYDIVDDEEEQFERDETEEEVKARIALYAKQDKGRGEISSRSVPTCRNQHENAKKKDGNGAHLDLDNDNILASEYISGNREEEEESKKNTRTCSTASINSKRTSKAAKTMLLRDAYGHSHTVQTPVCEIQGKPVFVRPIHGCTAVENAPQLKGSIAIIQRGNCSFQSKVIAAENAGAIAALIINNSDDEEEMVSMGTTAAVQMPTIPSAMIRKRDTYPIQRAVYAPDSYIKVWSPFQKRRVQLARRILRKDSFVVGGENAEKERVREVESAVRAFVAPMCDHMDAPEEVMKYNIELIVPPASQAWVMHHVYQQMSDFHPAFRQVASILVPDGDYSENE